MTNLAIIEVNTGERLLVRRGHVFSLDLLRVVDDERGRIELEFPMPVFAFAETGCALAEGRFDKIHIDNSRAVVVVPRQRRAMLLVLMQSSDEFRMVRLGARQRMELVTACEHVRAAAGDRSLLAEALEDVAIARETVFE